MNNLRITPVMCAAFGAAVGFYSAAVIPVWLFVVMFAAFCFLHALSSFHASAVKVRFSFVRLAAIYGIAIAAGFVFGMSASSAARNDVKFGISEEKIIALEGVLQEDPRIISRGRAMAVLSLRKSAGAGGLRVSSQGEITVFFPEDNALKLREFGRGTVVFTEGNLRNTSTGWVYGAESMHIVKPAPPLERMRTGIRLNLISRFENKQWGGLALALLIGIRDNLDTNLTMLYREAGCSYILALSGMHLAIIAALIAFFLKKTLGLKMAAVTGAIIIGLYCFLVGPMPSLNRSALMYLLGVFALLGAIPKHPMSVLALSFLIQLIIAPAEGNTVSFILSYVALAGILVIGQTLYSLFAGKLPDFILRSLAVSCGAFLASAVFTAAFFNVLAPMSIITSIFLVPLTTVFMIGSIFWLALDFLSLSAILDFPLLLIYQMKEKLVSIAGYISGISGASPLVVLVLSAVLSAVILFLEYRRRCALFKPEPFI
jgi:competence protein ComEC